MWNAESAARPNTFFYKMYYNKPITILSFVRTFLQINNIEMCLLLQICETIVI